VGGVPEDALRFLIAFVRSLLGSLSTDHIILAVGAAAKEIGMPRELADIILPSLLGYKKRNDIWPRGFMP